MDASAESSCFSSSPNSTTQPWKYHVFLSFRGEDTRKGFTAHLHAALQRSGIIAFIDDELQRGDVISDQLLGSIEDSLISLVIFSQNYASSTWCLDELQKILESRKFLLREVIPVFYNVDPSHVRHQKGAFAYAFEKHSERFCEDKEKVQKWRNALREAANLSGYHSNNQLETKLIEEIVEGVWKKLQPSLPCYKTKFVGMESKIEEVNSILKIGLNDVRFLGIWGMGGIGKTSLARVICETNCNQFDFYYFFADVRGVDKKKGLVHLQRKFLSRDGKLRSMEFDDAYEGMRLMRGFLWNQKVLIVLDDVTEINQLEYLAIKKSWLGPGSRVIVTTRNKEVLIAHGEFETYEAKLLGNEESFKLFCQRAFKSDKPKEDYFELTESVVKLAAGLPLTLEVLGSYLCGGSISEWKDALDKVKDVPPNNILKSLRICYEGLDPLEKMIFLDIACFFKGMHKDRVIRILEICGFHPKIGIRKLVQKCLLVEYQDNFKKWCLGMHDMLQEMGKCIVLEESPGDASKRSRLWSKEDINHVLATKKGTDLTEVIHLQSPMEFKASWGPEVFSIMHNLRILIISCDVCLPQGIKCLPISLKILEWEKYPLKSLPLDVHHPHELVEIKMQCSKVIKLWKETQMSEKLKVLDLSHSEDLIQTPDFSLLPNLEQLVLKGCIKLVEVHPSLGHHKKIIVVNLKDCKNLKTLPCWLEMDCLTELILSGCPKFKRLPEFGGNMNYLSILELEDCKNLLYLPSSIINLKSLKTLNVSGCSKFSSLPKNLDTIESIEEINVSGTAIREIPSSIVGLKCLRKLDVNGCSGFAPDLSQSLLSPILRLLGFNYEASIRLTLPPSISGLSLLKDLRLSNCNFNAGSIPNDLGCLPSLEILDLSGNDFGNLASGSLVLPPSFSNLSSLRELSLENCNLSDGSIPDDLSSLSSLEVLVLSKNKFTSLPSGFISKNLGLRFLHLNHCNRLLSLPNIPPHTRQVSAVGCSHPSMKNLSFNPEVGWRFPQILEGAKFESPFLSIFASGSEIPPWFHNRSIEFLDHGKSRISIKVDISRFSGSSERWRLFVCFVIQDRSENPNTLCQIRITSKSESGGSHFIALYNRSLEGNNPRLFIWAFSPHYFVENAHNQAELIIETSWELKQVEKVELITKCGWRLTSKQEMEECMQHQMP